MIQLAYQPAFDAFHSMYRILRLRPLIKVPVSRAAIRIVDFYLLFPFKLSDFSFRTGDRHYRPIARMYEGRKGYVEYPSGKLIFDQMEYIQDAALQTLSDRGYLHYDPATEMVSVGSRPLGIDLSARVSSDNKAESDLLELLDLLLNEYPLYGSAGLKARSQLLDHRYDAV